MPNILNMYLDLMENINIFVLACNQLSWIQARSPDLPSVAVVSMSIQFSKLLHAAQICPCCVTLSG